MLSERGTNEECGDDTFRFGAVGVGFVGVGLEVAAISSSSFQIEYSARTSVRVLDSESS